jgi:predicted TIM-barrel fold metal-dependent hydrolase
MGSVGERMSDSPITIVSGDGHVSGRPEDYLPYMDKLALDHYADYVEDNASKLVEYERFTTDDGIYGPDGMVRADRDGAIRAGGWSGAWDASKRLEEMDREGIAGEVLLLGSHTSMEPFFSPSNRETPLDVRASGLRAFHRWVADHIVGTGGRLLPTAETAGVDMAAICAELRWCKEHGFGGVQMPGLSADPVLPPLFDEWYEPFWATCTELGFVVQLHAGWGFLGHGRKVADAAALMMMQADPDTGVRVEGRPRQAMWQMMAGGVFDRHPTLTLVLTEIRADWIPATIATFDARAAHGDLPMALKPSEYFQRNCYVSPSSPRGYEVAMRHEIGIDRFLFGRDYPHPEGTWPNTFDWIRDSFAGVPEDEARMLLGGNAIRCFGFDEAVMAETAARIGPAPADVLGEHEIDTSLIEHFDLRSGYRKAPVTVDTGALATALDEELDGLVGAS